MNLLVDIGNTRIKWCIDEQGVMSVGQAVEHHSTAFPFYIRQQWLLLKQPKTLAISTVSAKQIEQQLVAMAYHLWPEITVIFAQSLEQGFSVRNAYQHTEKLGVDRWLNLIALHSFYPGNNAIIDCGTAITIDCIDNKAMHLGGVIGPGIQLMKQALSQGTDGLQLSDKTFSVALSGSTESAIYSGTLLAATGLIEKTVNDLCEVEKIILTGGDAELLAPLLNVECIVDVDFVLKGLALYCRERT